MHILIVEDEVGIVQFFAGFRRGYQVTSAFDGLQGSNLQSIILI
jgi:DNA-binding response OmpR family regulator